MTNQISGPKKRRLPLEFYPSELILLRHAKRDADDRLCGRTDVGLADGAEGALADLSAILPTVKRVVISPARRCRLTATGLWPVAELIEEPALWEQDFGDWEGLEMTELPDLGELSRPDLAELAGPGGESFLDLCARVHPVLRQYAEVSVEEGPVVIVAHAGIVRAGLSLALQDAPGGLAFSVDPLSLTRLGYHPDGAFSVRSVNWTPEK